MRARWCAALKYWVIFHFPFSNFPNFPNFLVVFIFWLAATELKPRKSADELSCFGCSERRKVLPLADSKQGSILPDEHREQKSPQAANN